MKTRNIHIILTSIMALIAMSLVTLAIDVPEPDEIPITTAQSFGAAGSTNYVVSGFDGIDFTGAGSAEGRQGLSIYRMLYFSAKGTNAAGTGSMKIHYAISYDGSTFTTDNTDRYCTLNFTSNQTVVAAVRVAAHGIKEIAFAGTSVQSANNGFTNLTGVVARSE